MTTYKSRITQEQAQTIISAYSHHMAIEWHTKDMIWLTYRLYPSIISILIREINSTRTPEKIVTYNVKSIELHPNSFLLKLTARYSYSQQGTHHGHLSIRKNCWTVTNNDRRN